MDRLQRELRDCEFQLEVARDKLRRAAKRVETLEQRRRDLMNQLGYTYYQEGWDVT